MRTTRRLGVLLRSWTALGLCLCLAASNVSQVAAQTVAAPIAGAAQGAAGMGAAGVALSQRQAFLSEMNLGLQGVNSLKLAPVSPSVEAPKARTEAVPPGQAPAKAAGKLSPEAAVVYMTAMAASPASPAEHAARQVLIEYAARPGIRAEVERALQSPSARAAGSRDTVAALREYAASYDALDKSEKLTLIKGLISLRKKLYASTSKAASVDGTRQNLALLFDGGGAGAEAAVSARGAESAGRRPALLKPVDPGDAPKGWAPTVEDLRYPDVQTLRNAQEVAGVMSLIARKYEKPITAQRLLMGLAEKADIRGALPAGPEYDPAVRQAMTSNLARQLGLTIRSSGEQALNSAAGAVFALLAGGLTPAAAPQDVYGIIKAMVRQTGDMYSRFLDPKETEEENLHMRSAVAGVGITMDFSKGGVLVTAVTPGGPAAKAGIQAGDRIVGVDGKPVKDPQEAGAIRGKPGTRVRLKVLRNGKELEVEAVRAVIPVPNVFGTMLPGRDGTAYLHFGGFLDDTDGEVLGRLTELREAGMKRLVLDLRENGGGRIDVAYRIINLFLKRGQVEFYVRQEGRTQGSPADHDGEFSDIPLTVLVDRHTASASEITSAALQDHGRALIVGEHTWGKGVGQSVMPLRLQGAITTMILTTLRWFSPKMRTIHSDRRGEGGVQPDAKLEMDKEGWIETVKSIQHGMYQDGQWDPAKDPWLQKAADLVEKR